MAAGRKARRSQRAAVASWIVVVLLASATALVADYKDAYKEGLVAVERKQWAKAEQLLRQAIAENPTSGGKQINIYGRRFEAYVPYFLLGKAQLARGDRQGARQAWQFAEQQGVVQRSSFKKEFGREWPELRATAPIANSGSPVEPPDTVPVPDTRPLGDEIQAGPTPEEIAVALRSATGAIVRAETAAQRLESEVGAESLNKAFDRDRGLAVRQQAATERIETARDELSAAKAAGDLEGLGQAERTARVASDELTTLLPEVQRILDRIDEQEANDRAEVLLAQNRVEDLRADGLRALQEADTVSPAPPQLLLLRPQLERLLEEVHEDVALADLERLETDLRLSVHSVVDAIRAARDSPPPEPLDSRPPDELVRAVRAYFAASYDQVLQVLSSAQFTDLRAQVQTHLLRAAAAFSLSRMASGDNADLLASARRQVDLLKGLQPGFTPDRERFSPAFLEFFESS